MVEVLRSNTQLQRWRDSAGRVAFVPTMGALHAGHASLIRHASSLASDPPGGSCLVSIFVNPTQFNDPADLARYPRTIEQDLETCRMSGAGAVYVPDVTDIYPPEQPTPTPPLPEAATRPGLEDARRPGHFAGVCQVVLRLFGLVRPESACFGEKDWQQYRVIHAMAENLALPVRIIPVPTVREPDGLAMSSRNRFLSPDERRRAISLSLALRESGRFEDPVLAEQHMVAILEQSGANVEYAVVRDAQTLLEVSTRSTASDVHPRRALLAARIGSVRLIDNAPWPVATASA